MFFRMRQRVERARRSDAMRLDLLKLQRPRFSAVHRSIGRPRELLRPDVEVANAPQRWIRCHGAERLLDAHFRAVTMSRAEVLQSASGVGRYELPAIGGGVVNAQGPSHVKSLVVVSHNP